MRAAAISWVIACGLLCGGTGVLWATPAGADPGTVGNSHDRQGAGGGSDSNDARPGGHRPGGPGKPRGDDATPGSGSRGHWHPGHHNWPHSDGSHSDWSQHGWPHRGRWLRLLPPGKAEVPPFSLPPDPQMHRPPPSVGMPQAPSLTAPAPAAVGGGGGGGGGVIDLRPRTIPPPGEPGLPGEPPVASAEHGTVGPISLEPPPITMPPMIGLPPPAFPPPMRPGGPSTEPGPRTGPGRESATTRERPPATSAGAGTEMPPSTRVGYPRYLQEAKMGEVAAVALPGFAGILALTALGGVVGYRQARAGHVVRTAGTTRFMQ